MVCACTYTHTVYSSLYTSHMVFTCLWSADVSTEKKRVTHPSRTSLLPGSPWGPEAAFSITAATTHPASMILSFCNSPLWRTWVGGKGERAREGRKEGEWMGGWVKSRGWEVESDAMKPPDVNPLEAAACTTLKARNHKAHCNLQWHHASVLGAASVIMHVRL